MTGQPEHRAARDRATEGGMQRHGRLRSPASMAGYIDESQRFDGSNPPGTWARRDEDVLMNNGQDASIITTANVWARELVVAGNPVRQLLVPASALNLAEEAGGLTVGNEYGRWPATRSAGGNSEELTRACRW